MCVANLSSMDSKIISIPVLSGEAFEALPESIRAYIRYLESTIQQLHARVHETWNIWDSLADAIRGRPRLLNAIKALFYKHLPVNFSLLHAPDVGGGM